MMNATTTGERDATGGDRGEEAAPSGDDFERFAHQFAPTWATLPGQRGTSSVLDRLLELLASPTSAARLAFDLGRRWEQRETIRRLLPITRAVRAS